MSGVAGALPTVFTTRFASVSDGAWLLIVQSAATVTPAGSRPVGATEKVCPFGVPSGLVRVAVAGVALRFASRTAGLK